MATERSRSALSNPAPRSPRREAAFRHGSVFQDYDNDGKPDIIVTELPREIYGLYHNDAEARLQSKPRSRPRRTYRGSSGWGVGLEDFDNDG